MSRRCVSHSGNISKKHNTRCLVDGVETWPWSGKKVTGQWSEHIPRAVVVAWNIAHIRILIAALETRVLT